MFRIFRPIGAFALVVSAAGCRPDVTLPANHAASESVTRIQSSGLIVETFDESLARIAEGLPSFGGAYPDGRRLIVQLKRGIQSPQGIEANIRQALRTNLLGPRNDLTRYSEAEFAFETVDYSFRELQRARKALTSDGLLPGTIFSGIDKQANRVYLGVASTAVEAGWRDLAKSRGIPDGLIKIEVVEVPVPHIGIRDYQRPMPGGAKIAPVWSKNNVTHVGTCC